MRCSRTWTHLAANALFLVVLAGCGSRPSATERTAAARTDTLPVDVYADTGRGGRLHIAVPAEPPGPATVRIARVTPVPPEMAEPPPSAPESAGVAPLSPVAVDPNLKPPILRTRAALAVPAGALGRVELDVRVNESGAVTDARWAGGSADSSLVRAAMSCALAMRFYPAMRAGRPVAVWCREHFDFGETAPDD